MINRLSIYFKEMFPLQLYFPLACITFLGLYCSVQKVVLGGNTVLGVEIIIGVFSLFSFSLLMRIFDEFKDYEIDKILFPHRALVRGAVRKSDLIRMGLLLATLMILFNSILGWVLIPFFVTLFFGILTYKWFYLKELISNNLLLAFVTHQPMGLLVNLYAVAVALHTVPNFRWEAGQVGLCILIALAYFFPVSAWETARKIRAPTQETNYVTYSKLLGPRWACLLPMLFVSLSGISFLFIFRYLSMPIWSQWFVIAIICSYIFICVRFMVCLSEKSNILRLAAECSLSSIQLVFLGLLLTTA